MRILTYMACPYTHPWSAVRQERFRKATVAAAWLSMQGKVVFSPITHSHPMAEMVDMPTDWEFWKEIDEQYLQLSKELTVLAIEGWEKSTGVRDETIIAERMGIPVNYLDYDKSWEDIAHQKKN